MELVEVDPEYSCVTENAFAVECVRREVIALGVPETADAALYSRTAHFSQDNLHYHLVPAISNRN